MLLPSYFIESGSFTRVPKWTDGQICRARIPGFDGQRQNGSAPAF